MAGDVPVSRRREPLAARLPRPCLRRRCTLLVWLRRMAGIASGFMGPAPLPVTVSHPFGRGLVGRTPVRVRYGDCVTYWVRCDPGDGDPVVP